MKKIKLHIRIFAGFILGIIFGIISRADKDALIITSSEGKEKLKNWNEIKIISSDKSEISFKYNEVNKLIKHFESIGKKRSEISVIVVYKETVKEYRNVSSISISPSLATEIKPLGEIFIRLLNMIAVPLVLASLIVGAASLHDLRNLTKIGGKTIAFFLITCSVSVALGMFTTMVIKPGTLIPQDIRLNLIHTYQQENLLDYRFDLIEFIVNIVPRNPIKSMVEGDFLQLVFFAVLTGLVLYVIPRNKAQPVINFFEGLSLALIRMVENIILLAPYAVFALIAATVSEFGFDILHTLLGYALSVILALLAIAFVLYPALVKFLARVNPIDFFLAQKKVIALAFTTSSSSATLPVTLDITENKLGVPNKIASFIVPLGATLNKSGTAAYQAVAAIFIAQVYGFEISSSMLTTIFITSVITGMATAPVAGAGLIMLIVILKASGLPEEGIALIVGIDRIINMCRTTVNVLGDTTASVVIAKTEKALGKISRDD